ncbi:Serine/threonine-protein kinase MHK [Raphanus sativus]|nr:Serine/threonine-protein kinase MHK [Raphanus sativus]
MFFFHRLFVKLKEIAREHNELFFIFECMDHNLYQIMKEREQRPFSEGEIRSYVSQMLQGLAHMHKNGYFHPDLKPENLLVINNILKMLNLDWLEKLHLCLLTLNMCLRVGIYLRKFCYSLHYTLLQLPDWTTFPEAKSISWIMSISHTEFPQTRIADLLPNASPEAIDLITRLCSWDPLKRPTADQALNHSFFNIKFNLFFCSAADMPNLELNLWDFNTKQDECFLRLTLAVKPSAPKLEMVCNASQDMSENFLFCPMVNKDREPSVFWSLLSPDESRGHAPVESCPLSLSFRLL